MFVPPQTSADRGFRLTHANLLAFSAGVCTLWLWPRLPAWPVLSTTAAIVLVVAWRLPHAFRHAALCLLAGMLWSCWHGDRALSLRLPTALEDEEIVAVGRVDDLPQRDEDALRFRFCPERVEHRGVVVAAVRGCWRLSWYARHGYGGLRMPLSGAIDALPALRAGERWRLTVRLKRPRGLVNPGGFDSERKALETGVAAVGYVRRSPDNRRLAGAAGIDALRERIARRIDVAVAEDGRTAALLRGLAVGDRRGFADADWTTLRRTGTTHLFSISGLHVGMVALFVGALAMLLTHAAPRLLRRAPRRIWALPPALLAALGYALLAGFEVPTRRSLAMIAIAALVLLLRRHVGLWHGWSLALATVLALDPLAALSVGFWLSFLGVAWLLLAAQQRGRQAWWRTASRAQWAVSIGLLPIGIGFFAQASWVSPLVNLVAIPWVTFAVVPVLLLSLPLSWLWPAAGAALVQLAALVLSALMSGLDAVAQWPVAASVLPEPGVLAVAGASLAAALCLMPARRTLRWLALPLILPLLRPTTSPPAYGDVEMHVLDVGQGTAVLVRTREHALLFDTGARYPNGFDLGGAVVVPALQALGVHRLDTLVVSHADNDHAGGAASVLAQVPAAQVLLGEPVPGVAGEPCHEHRRWRWDGVDFRLLHPPPGYPTEGNDVSCVLKIDARGGSALLTGDAGDVAEMRLLNLHRRRLRAEVLLLGHHGSRHSSSAAFIDAVSPRLAVATAGYRNRFGHPHRDVLQRLSMRGIGIATTFRTGAVAIVIGADGVERQARREARRHFWHEP